MKRKIISFILTFLLVQPVFCFANSNISENGTDEAFTLLENDNSTISTGTLDSINLYDNIKKISANSEVPINDPINKCEAEIDIMAYKNKDAIFTECKWTNEKVNLKILNHLIEKSKIFNYKNNYYYLFAKSGFKKSIIEFAQNNQNVRLFSFEDMNKP